MRGDQEQNQERHSALEGVCQVQREFAHKYGGVEPAIGVSDADVAGGGADTHTAAHHRRKQLEGIQSHREKYDQQIHVKILLCDSFENSPFEVHFIKCDPTSNGNNTSLIMRQSFH